MATSTPTTPSEPPSDPTFRHYTASQATSYQTGRPAHPDALTQTILTRHTTTGGQLDTLSTSAAGRHRNPLLRTPFKPRLRRRPVRGDDQRRTCPCLRFSRDPSYVRTTNNADSLRRVCCGDLLDPVVGPESVDLLTAATAAHWFDMSLFWPRASFLVRPGGTVALWTGVGYYCHPHSTPNAKEVQVVLDRLEHETLAPYKTRGNEISNSMYRELAMPWDVGDGSDGGEGWRFPREEFVRKEWNVDGEVGEWEKFFQGHEIVSLEQFAEACGTASMVTRWREAHPGLVGTERDVVSVAVRELRVALGGQGWFEGGCAMALLLFKRR